MNPTEHIASLEAAMNAGFALGVAFGFVLGIVFLVALSRVVNR